MSAHPVPIKVFYFYTDTDEDLCTELDKHLMQLQYEGLMAPCHKRQIIAGTNWKKALDQQLNTASVILLLISADFMASEYYKTGIQRAMQQHKAGEARIIPILFRACDTECAPFGELQVLPSNGKPVMSWPDRDEAFTDIAQGIRTVLRKETLRLTTNTASTTFPCIWNIPYSRNPLFTGREEILSRIHTQSQTTLETGVSQPQAITGLGGIGKTQLAIEYAYRHRQDYQAVFWTLADTPESLASGCVAIAEMLNLPEKDEQDQTKIYAAVKSWLTTQTEWLLILDNVDDLALVYEFLPPRCNGHILLTTRAQATGPQIQRIEVEVMSQDEGALFLLRRAKLTSATADDEAKARQICKELGGLPLALDQAGAYIEETQCSLIDYQSLYHEQGEEILKVRREFANDYPKSVATTWTLSFRQVEQQNPAAADLLRFSAFLAPDAIPEELLKQGATFLGPGLEPIVTNQHLLNQAVKVLLSYSLIRRDSDEKTFSVHRLVQKVLKGEMNEQIKHQWTMQAVQAVQALGTVLPEVDHADRKRNERYLAHALECIRHIEHLKLASLDAARLLYQTARYLREYARYTEAEPLYSKALHICEQRLGREHFSVAYPLTGLANLYYDQYRYVEAIPLYERALRIWEQPEHPNVAYPLNGLANLYQRQHSYEKAELHHQRALRIWEQIPGNEDFDVTYPLNGLANLYNNQGKYEEAKRLYQRTLSIYEQALGLGHPNMAYLLDNLANLYRKQGKHKLAEQLYQWRLSIWEQILGRPLHQESSGTGILNTIQRLPRQKENSEPEWPLDARAKKPNMKKLINNFKQENSEFERLRREQVKDARSEKPDMKKLINNPEDIVKEALAGMLAAHSDLISVNIEQQLIVRKDARKKRKVGIVSSGGSGHEPLHSGFVGAGMLDAACIGPIFTSPTRDQIRAAIRAANRGDGVLYILKNHRSDKSNFWSAVVELASDNIDIAFVLVNDDVGVPGESPSNRRGTGVTVVLEKIVGSFAETGASLNQVADLAKKVNKNGRSMGMALTSCILPSTGKPLFELSDDEITIGTGIHGECGHSTIKWKKVDKIVDRLVTPIIKDLDLKAGEKVLAMVSGMGGTPLIELYVVFNALKHFLEDKKKITITRQIVGNYITSLEMAGCTITLVRLDDELTTHWDAPVRIPALPWLTTQPNTNGNKKRMRKNIFQKLYESVAHRIRRLFLHSS